MRKIEMVDLVTQYQKIKPEVDKAIFEVLETGKFIRGPQVSEFAENLENYLGSKHVIPCANGTDALQIAAMALDLKPGDEIITASFTYVATAEIIALLGLTPVLVDVDPNTFCIDPKEVEKAITPKTKAIVPVHLFGQCADMEAIIRIAKQHSLFIIEDNAQALGAIFEFSNGDKKPAGTMGEVGTTSFFPSKNLGCFGDGGAIFTQDEKLANKIKMIANHGQSKLYHHDLIGVNSRLDTVQAAILNVKLPHLDSYASARLSVADFYDQQLGGHPKLKVPFRNPKCTHVFHQYTIICEGIDRDYLREQLALKGIPSMVYYPVPLHFQKAFNPERYPSGQFPVTEELCKKVLSLPISTEMDLEQLNYISKNILEILNN